DPIVYDRSLFVNEDGSYADKVVLVYTITEVNGGASGYTYDDKVITVIVTLTDNGEGEIIADVVYDVEATFNNTYNPLIEITVSKVWDDADDRDSIRPKSVFVNLLADGEILQTAELNADNNWTYTFTELYKFGSEGKEIVYTVKEADIPAGYTVEIVGNASDGFVITNIHKPTPDTPQTGDVSRPNWSYLMLFALVGAIAAGTALFVLKRKQR
ncbi:MAG: Cna B-type domain-containing protein, partial [Clostridia bacterium]|nr:Cna B-type domain-containing protein [Clostridia bacterium]